MENRKILNSTELDGFDKVKNEFSIFFCEISVSGLVEINAVFYAAEETSVTRVPG